LRHERDARLGILAGTSDALPLAHLEPIVLLCRHAYNRSESVQRLDPQLKRVVVAEVILSQRVDMVGVESSREAFFGTSPAP
jgi:hypothetical protein